MIHGSIATVVVFLLWIYVSSVILMYGVEFTAAYARLRRRRPRRCPRRPARGHETAGFRLWALGFGLLVRGLDERGSHGAGVGRGGDRDRAHANAQVRKQMPELKDATVTRYVRDVGQAARSRGTGTKYPYTFAVADFREINAFALPGGPSGSIAAC